MLRVMCYVKKDYKQSFILAFSVLAVIILSVVFFIFTSPVIKTF